MNLFTACDQLFCIVMHMRSSTCPNIDLRISIFPLFAFCCFALFPETVLDVVDLFDSMWHVNVELNVVIRPFFRFSMSQCSRITSSYFLFTLYLTCVSWMHIFNVSRYFVLQTLCSGKKTYMWRFYAQQ